MIEFAPHRKLILERIADLEAAAASSVWISDSLKSDIRLQSSLTIRGQGSSSWNEAQCVNCIRKAFPFFSVGTAYDVAREFGGESCNADDAIAILMQDASLVRAKAASSVLMRHTINHLGHPVPLWAPLRRLKYVAMATVAIAVLYFLGLLALAEAYILRSLIHCLGYINTFAMYVQIAMQKLVAGVSWAVGTPVAGAIRDQLVASLNLLTTESER